MVVQFQELDEETATFARQLGVKAVQLNFLVNGVWRTDTEAPGRGGALFGFDLCLGTMSEMEGGPAAVRAAIETFGPLGAICYVHFRQVQGTVPSFKECFLGEGNCSPREVVDLLRASGFDGYLLDGYLLDDHVPKMAGDTAWGHRARAHAIGYLQGLLDGAPTPVPERLDRPAARAVGSAVGLEGGV